VRDAALGLGKLGRIARCDDLNTALKMGKWLLLALEHR